MEIILDEAMDTWIPIKPYLTRQLILDAMLDEALLNIRINKLLWG